MTGALHLGHALNNTLQDILIRWQRMQGYNTLWMPGTDHAGIATQAVVERRLFEEEKKTRHDLGREALVERIWDWKNEYETRILGQLKQLGFSLRLAADAIHARRSCCPGRAPHVFQLVQRRLIYRGKRLVNWDTHLQTAVSDDEVFHETVDGHFWHLQLSGHRPPAGRADARQHRHHAARDHAGRHGRGRASRPCAGSGQRPKPNCGRSWPRPAKKKAGDRCRNWTNWPSARRTLLPQLIKLRDMALAGRKLMLPLVNREIPLVADVWAKPELGSGCVKITPAHDPNDYDVGQRQNLPHDQHPESRRHAERQRRQRTRA